LQQHASPSSAHTIGHISSSPWQEGKKREKATKEQECKFMVRQSCVDVASGVAAIIYCKRGLPGGRKVGLGAGPKVKVPQGAV